MIYAYGIREPGGAPLPGRGLRGAVLREVEVEGGELTAVYSRHRTLRPHPSTALVLAHVRVVEALMDRGPVLPMRFGTMLDGEEALAAALAARRDGLRRALTRVRGRVELGLRLLRTDPGPRPAGETGRGYLLARAEEQRRADAATRDVHAPLAELAAASVVRRRPTPSPSAIMVAAYLVDTDRVPDFRARAAEIAGRHRDVRAVLTGPWPPYSFTGDDDPGDDPGADLGADLGADSRGTNTGTGTGTGIGIGIAAGIGTSASAGIAAGTGHGR